MATIKRYLLLALALGDPWSIHFQTTLLTQGHSGFNSPYSGTNSLNSYEEIRTSVTSTLFAGRPLWSGAAFYIDPEITGGSGVSDTHGLAGYPNAEIYRVDSADPKFNISRIYVSQIFDLSGEKVEIDDDKNQIPTTTRTEHLTLSFGKFSLNDFFDNNSYSHDPRTQFFNWALMDNAAWDYAADTRGYTWGFYFEYDRKAWAFRGASVLEPDQANQMGLDFDIKDSHGDNLEFEYRSDLLGRPGKLRLLGFYNHAHMGNYRQALSLSPTAPDITTTRDYRTKYGWGLNLEQELTGDIGLFSRLSWNNGTTETWAFTEVDQSFSLGVSLRGGLWSREMDTLGAAGIVNGLSSDHTAYLGAGGSGFIIGDGALNYAPEEIFETYYLYRPGNFFGLALDYQFINNPAYNQDRGPVHLIAGRGHFEF